MRAIDALENSAGVDADFHSAAAENHIETDPLQTESIGTESSKGSPSGKHGKKTRLLRGSILLWMILAVGILILAAVSQRLPTVAVFSTAALLLLLLGWILVLERRRERALHQALLLSDSRFRAVFLEAPPAMTIVDDKHQTLISNHAWQEMLSSSNGHDGDDGGRTASSPLLLRSLPLQDSRQTEICLRRIDGTNSWGRLQSFRIQDENAADLRVCMVHDITELKRTELALRTVEVALKVRSALITALAEADTADEAISKLVETVCEQDGWSTGSFWAVDQRDSVLRQRCVWTVRELDSEEYRALQRRTISPDEGVLGRVWVNHTSLWITGKPAEEWVCQVAGKPLRSAFCFPISRGDDVYGVVGFWSTVDRDVDEEFVRSMTLVGDHIGKRISRAGGREQTTADLRARERRYRLITEVSREAIITMDQDSCILAANAAADRLFGYQQGELVGQSLTILMPEYLRESHAKGIQRYCETGQRSFQWEGLELPGVRSDGSPLLLEISLAELKEGARRTFVGYLRDITKRKEEETALIHQAVHDTLTDLPNRALLQDRLERSLASAHRHESSVALLFMDLDRFKEVNDTLGHHSGDQLLQEVALRLQDSQRESDTVARLGGDEFAFLLPGTDEAGAEIAAARVVEALREPFKIEGKSFEIGASIGIATFPQHGADASTLMRHADVAMYAAKRSSSGYAMYSAERDEANAMRLVLTSELRKAIDNGELLLHYQPKVDIKTGRADHVEALIRWQHPERGYMSPDGFIPLAEETGLVKPLTIWVLNEALTQQRRWREEGLNIGVSVNFSARTIHEPDLVDAVCRLLDEWELEPSGLQVEITESAIMADPDRALESITRLRNAGVWTSIDDFGTGYSSLGYLKRLPIDEIKIDKSFILDLAMSRDDSSIVRSVVTLGHNLELRVVAEGVDNKRSLDMLAAMGCDLAQGYYISPPLPADEIKNWLTLREARLRRVQDPLRVVNAPVVRPVEPVQGELEGVDEQRLQSEAS